MKALDRDNGITLLEVAIAVALLTLVFGESIYLSLRVQDHLTDEVVRLTIDETADRVSRRVFRHLMQAYPSSVTPAVLDDDEVVQFQKVTGYSGGTVQLGPVNSIQFQLATGETDNGLDDNGDGRIDEGTVVHTVDGVSTIVAANLLGLAFTSSAGGISFSFDIGLLGEDGSVVQRSFSRQVRLRN